MTIVIFTPTRQYGLDVTFRGIARQEKVDLSKIVWVVGDELFDERPFILKPFLNPLTVHFNTKLFRLAKPELVKTYVHAYQYALEFARAINADMFVSLQDYVVPPADGLSRFIMWNEEISDGLFTGLMSFSTDPPPEAIVNPTGKWTIFDHEFKEYDIPERNGWQDVRAERCNGNSTHVVEATWWETNWAAIGRKPLHDKRLNFSLEYDMGIAYENQDFALQAQDLGYQVYLDGGNHAVGLPHKSYWPHQEIEEAEINQANRRRHEEKWQGRF